MRRYRALRIIAALSKASGVLFCILAVVAFIGSLAIHLPLNTPMGLLTGIGSSLVLFIAGVAYYGFGELINLFIDIEGNTRAGIQRSTAI